MIVISDRSPINYLVLIGEIDILLALYERVLIPQAVFDEMQRARTPAEVRTWVGAPPEWFEVRQADRALFTPRKKLGVGETEAIALSLELNADAVLMDDKDAVKEAKRNNITVTSTLTILELAAEEDLLNLPEAVDELRRTSFRFPSEEMISEMLDRDARRKQSSS